jgi:hypothetical protein
MKTILRLTVLFALILFVQKGTAQNCSQPPQWSHAPGAACNYNPAQPYPYAVSLVQYATGYNWRIDGPGFSGPVSYTTSEPYTFFSPPSSGTYTLSVSANLRNSLITCTTPPTTVQIIVYAVDQTSPITVSPNINAGCSAIAVTYSIPSGQPNYYWSVSSSESVVTYNSQSINVNWKNSSSADKTESVSVYFQDVHGCNSIQSTTSMLVYSSPLPTLSSSLSTDPCKGTSVVYSTETGMNTYSWSVSAGGSILSGGGSSDYTATVLWNASGSQSVSVNYGNNHLCQAALAATKNVNVIALSAPTITSSIGASPVCRGSKIRYSTELGMVNYLWTVSSGGTITMGASSPNVSIIWNTNASGSQTVTVNYQDPNGCQTAASTSLLQNISPTINQVTSPAISAGSTSFCQGNSVILNAPSAASYQWSDGETSQSINVNSASTFFVTATDANNCKSTTDNLSTTVLALPDATISYPGQGQLSLCQGEWATLSVNSIGTYEWRQDGNLIAGATGNSILVNSVGTYSVKITDSNGCVGQGSAPPLQSFPNPTIIGPTTSYPGTNETYTTETGHPNYNWAISPGGNFTQPPLSPPPNTHLYNVPVTWAAAGTSQNINVRYDVSAGKFCSTVLFVTVSKFNQTISFSPLAVKTYGDASFPLTATASSGLPVSFTSSNPGVATVSGNIVTIVGAGSTNITATQPGDPTYNGTSAMQTLTVNKATLIATANNQSKTYGFANPALTLTYSGFLGSDNSSVIDAAPTISTSAVQCTSAGSYTISLSSGSDNNYAIGLVNGTLTISKTPLSVKADPKTKAYGSPNPLLTFTYLAFACSDNAGVIDTPPTITTTATTNSSPGVYPITLSGGSDNNYSFTLAGDFLTVSPIEALGFNGDSGNNQYVKLSDVNGRFNLGTGQFVLEAYCKPSPLATLRTLLSKRTFVNGSLSDGFLFGIWNDGRPFIQLKGSPNILPNVGSANLFDGICHWVAVRRSGNTISFFVDGSYIGNGNSTSNRNMNSTGLLQIASDPPVPTAGFTGWIGEVRIWNISLSNSQITSNTGIVLQPQTGLVGYYTMTDSYGSQSLSDLSTANASLKNNGILGTSTTVDASDPVWQSASQAICGNSGGRIGIGDIVTYDYISDSTQNERKIIVFEENEFARIFPNPTSGEFHLQVHPSPDTFDLKIVDTMGKEVESQFGLSPGEIYNLGDGWVRGMYVILIQQGNTRKSYKVVIN